MATVRAQPVWISGETDLTEVLTRGSNSTLRKRVPLSGRTVAELKEYCKAHNLDLIGQRSTLVERVRAHAARHPARAWEPVVASSSVSGGPLKLSLGGGARLSNQDGGAILVRRHLASI